AEVKAGAAAIDDLAKGLLDDLQAEWDALNARVRVAEQKDTAEGYREALAIYAEWQKAHPKPEGVPGLVAKKLREYDGQVTDSCGKIEGILASRARSDVEADRKLWFDWLRDAYAPRPDDPSQGVSGGHLPQFEFE